MLLLATDKLCDHPLSSFWFPDAGKMEQFAAMINACEPLLDDVIVFMDGVSLPTECTSEENEHNAMYDGYTCNTTVNNVLAYGHDGKVFLSALNFPGSWNDGRLSTHFIEFIKQKIGRYKICVDQGFPRQGEAYGILVGPISRMAARGLHRDERDYLLKISNIHTSLRQAGKWGMCRLQGSFPRLMRRLPPGNSKRRLVLEAIVFVHNLQTDMLGRIKSKPFLIQSMNKFMFLRDMIAFVNTIFSQVNMILTMMTMRVRGLLMMMKALSMSDCKQC